ncbi:TPA: hypothetical protein ACS29X_004526 [Klebsiella oxytoca]|uniref:hypothetical protein n=1 Tax=Klebsiella quasipneumoniae TaxID=1463165 RepID=UPI001A262B23|nr:hypothetical protein [Klebsiella quasipneumoniae]ELX8408197.1 hypothetical protein [Klebsiella oxytoca]MDH8200680.1 hypothetical protein [Klebsiella pneumoniae]HDU5252488.1 hypothetical protein [Klebsiella pneumoniae subsp. pneumoniae]MDH8334812.1 hypothetical protein [Klebsiella pneumoniae]BDO22804.1 hypothetical protein KAM645c_58940 [Klebsiella quasipneumoniae subsp. quasipneumoniae]
MKTWIDSDDICKNTRDVLSVLSAPDHKEFKELNDIIILVEQCIDDEEYDFVLFSSTTFSLLKSLLKIRLKLRKSDPSNTLIPTLSLVIDEIRKQLKLNEVYIREQIQVDMFTRRYRMSWVVAVSLVLAALFYAVRRMGGW